MLASELIMDQLPPELLQMMAQVSAIGNETDESARNLQYDKLQTMLNNIQPPPSNGETKSTEITSDPYFHCVPTPIPSNTNLRMTNYTHATFPSIETVTRARKLIKRGFILLNGSKVETSRFVSSGDILTIDIDALTQDDASKRPVYKLDIPVVYEDEHLAVVNKPSGIVTSGDRIRSLENALSSNLRPSKLHDAMLPQPVHRLDLMTSGLVCVAKTRSIRTFLGKEFELRKVQKRYRAIVVGKINENTDSGVIETSIDGKECKTEWKVISRTRSLHTDWITTLDLYPKTGRKHQLRIHCVRDLGCPIVGKYLSKGASIAYMEAL